MLVHLKKIAKTVASITDDTQSTAKLYAISKQRLVIANWTWISIWFLLFSCAFKVGNFDMRPSVLTYDELICERWPTSCVFSEYGLVPMTHTVDISNEKENISYISTTRKLPRDLPPIVMWHLGETAPPLPKQPPRESLPDPMLPIPLVAAMLIAFYLTCLWYLLKIWSLKFKLFTGYQEVKNPLQHNLDDLCIIYENTVEPLYLTENKDICFNIGSKKYYIYRVPHDFSDDELESSLIERIEYLTIGSPNWLLNTQKVNELSLDNSNSKLIAVQVCWVSSVCCHWLRNCGTLSERDVKYRQCYFGFNTLQSKQKTFGEMYFTQLTSPVVIFQVFTTSLWLLDRYSILSLGSILMVLVTEAITLIQRRKNMAVVAGNNTEESRSLVYRDGLWTSIPNKKLVPGDLITIVGTSGINKPIIPADCVLLGGSAVMNEASITGESVPQMKEAINNNSERFNMMQDHKLNVLYSGTEIIYTRSISSTIPKRNLETVEFCLDPYTEIPSLPDNTNTTTCVQQPPSGSAIARVIATGPFSTYGEMTQMLLYTQKDVLGDTSETLYAMFILLICAMIGSFYVFYQSRNKESVDLERLIVRCVTIITSVIPPQLPMQLAIAVNMALASLTKQEIFCTQPGKIATSGKITHILCDKTGTLTADALTPIGLYNLQPHSLDKGYQKTSEEPILLKETPMSIQLILGACHALMHVDGDLIGDPLELASYELLPQVWDDLEQKSYFTKVDVTFNRRMLLSKQPESSDPVQNKQMNLRKSNLESRLTDLRKNMQTIAPNNNKLSKSSIKILTRYYFSSALQRMTVIGELLEDNLSKTHFVVCKGSPERVGSLCKKLPDNYHTKYKELARQGMRIIALAIKTCTQNEANIYSSQRIEAEKDLEFVGLLALRCEVRSDSACVVRALQESDHKVIMLTGDALEAAAHAASICHIIKERPRLSLQSDGQWYNIDTEEIIGSFDNLSTSQLALKYDIMATENSLNNVPGSWESVIPYASVLGRMTPQGKVRTVEVIKSIGGITFMVGDGGNDVGALKIAHSGLALLSGFGSATIPEDKFKLEKATYENPWDELEQLAEARKKKMEVAQELAKVELESVKKHLQEKQSKDLASSVENTDSSMMSRAVASQRIAQEYVSNLNKARAQIYAKYHTSVTSGDSLQEALAGSEIKMIKPGDASISAPFTTRQPSIRNIIDIVRQGRCTLLSVIQQQQIMILESIITAYTLATLALSQGRSSEIQMMAQSMCIMVASLAFSHTVPVSRIHPVRMVDSLFHPAVVFSLAGQAAIHLITLLIAVRMCHSYMGEESLKQISLYYKKINAMPADLDFNILPLISDPVGARSYIFDKLWGAPYYPNLLSTVVFLVQSLQQVSVMIVNFKGRPWMRGVTENHALLISALVLTGLVSATTWGVTPEFNKLLQLVEFPNDQFRFQLMGLLSLGLLGALIWDRISLLLFAPAVGNALLNECRTTKVKDLLPMLMTVMKVVVGVFFFFSGNVLLLGIAYFMYRRMNAKNKVPVLDQV